jgi:hypothetical protein
MDSKSRILPVWVSILAATAVTSLLVVAGCVLDKNGSPPESVFTRIGGQNGQLLEPKRCMLKVVILNRPFGDPAINEVVWRAADEQILAPAERRAWESNGLRAGRITGEFPVELEAILKDTAPGKKVVPISIFPESGEQSLIRISDSVEQASLLLNRDNRAFGKDYNDASGFFRVTVAHDGSHGVSLRLVPEIHHGPIQRNFQAVPNAAPLATQELKINDGQKEETLRDLPVNLVVEPGQAIVVGCFPEQKRGLGSFLFTQSVASSDQREQRLIVLWASRNKEGVVETASTPSSDRPAIFKRLITPVTKSPTALPKPKAAVPPLAPLAIPEMPKNNAPATNAAPASAPTATSTKTDDKSGVPAQSGSQSTGSSDPASTAKSDQTP